MEILDKVEIYLDDLEIVEKLSSIKPFDELGGKTILQYLDQNTGGKNFSICFILNRKVYTLLKFDKDIYTDPNHEDDIGLVMMISDVRYSINQLQFIKIYDNAGGSLKSNAVKERLAIIQASSEFTDMLWLFN